MNEQLSQQTVAMIGCGKMGECLVKGLIGHGHSPEQIIATRRDTSALEYLKSTYRINISTDNSEAIRQSDIIVLAIKPQQLKELASTLSTESIAHKPIFVSVMSGLSIASIKQQFHNSSLSVFRAMPNTPSFIQKGVTALLGESGQSSVIEALFNTLGETVWVENEELMDVVTALSGSGPAYYFSFMRALEEQAIELGLPSDIAQKLNRATALGSVQLASAANEDLGQLTKNVTSPGGTTEAALKVFEQNNFSEIVKQAIQAAHHRANELGLMEN